MVKNEALNGRRCHDRFGILIILYCEFTEIREKLKRIENKIDHFERTEQ